MAKILVADDNSNVQKTVALALADLGVEVVAVNNGDAAVRKLGDVNPDVVLADIFMPVRNGYEVCDYVKKDSRFAHVPVVLLVGAFDPLDEREAQRVGADGILKKPFVPPDPLIAMVKTLLDRSLNEKLVAVGANTKPAAASQGKAAANGSAMNVEERPVPPPAQAAAPAIPELSLEPVAEEETHLSVDRLSFGEGEAPVAFGQLLDPPVAESAETETEAEAIQPVEDDQVLTSSRDANLGEPAFWKAEDPEPEMEEGENAAEDDGSHDFSRSWGLGEDALASHEDGEQAQSAEPAEATEADEPLELVRDEDASAGSPSIAEPSISFAQDAASQASLHVQAGRVQDLAANPLDWMATAPQQHEDEAPVEEETGGPWTAEEAETSESAEPAQTEPEHMEEMQLEPESFVLPEPPAPPLPAPPPAASPVGVMGPASFLGTSIPPSRPPVPPPASSAPPQPKAASPASDPAKTVPPFKRIDQSVEDTAHAIPLQQWADLTAGLERPAAPPAQNSKPAAPSSSVPSSPAPAAPASRANASSVPASTSSPESVSPDPALVEAVVQRVLDKMRPQVVDIITKEFLRPVVQALVHREINREPTKH